MVQYGECDVGLVHDDGVEGGVLHYFGCLEFRERDAFLQDLENPEELEKKISEDETKLKQLEFSKKSQEEVEKEIYSLKQCIEDHKLELKNNGKLKQRILEEKTRIKKLRKIFDGEGADTVAGKLLRSFRITLSARLPRNRIVSQLDFPAPQNTQNPGSRPDDVEDDVVLNDLNANVVFFKKDARNSEVPIMHPGPYDHPKLPDKFPNQKVPLSLLLKDDKERNPLMWKCEDDMIRYFHLPANNMDWIEVGISSSRQFASPV